MSSGGEQPLARLRDDLALRPGAPTINGEPRWLIYDPVRHRYFEITEHAFELLALWPDATADSLKQRARMRYQRIVDDEEIEELSRFLLENSLSDEPAGGNARSYLEQAETARRSLLMHGIHGYLFVKFPLFRPSRFLQATYPFIAPLYSWLALAVTAVVGVLGLYLVSRQWDQFTHTFLHFFSTEGFIYYGLSLILIKTLHEMAHAYTATRYGVRVPTMGVALMVMFPVLYTDVTDAWRLRSKRQRLAIAGAGIVMELSIACFATLAWVLLPNGPCKSIAFTLAASSWILSLAINLNPLMRFDGYYLLADLWGISNLQTRAFAMGRWWMREVLFGLGHPPPDHFSRGTRIGLVIYAFATWIYRLLLFIGIALLVYHMFFKALGIILFAIEILYFIAFPILREFKVWWQLRSEIVKTVRTVITCAAVAALISLSVVPWSSTIVIPAIFEADVEARVFAPTPARIETVLVTEGSHVAKGQILARLKSPDIEHKLQLTERKIDLVKERIARTASGRRELGNSAVLIEELAALKEERDGHLREIQRLTLRAPSSGVVRDIDALAHPGRWIKNDELLMRVVDGRVSELRGILGEDDIWRIEVGAKGRFVPDDAALESLNVWLEDINVAGERRLHNDYLASIYGGPIAVERDENGDLKPVTGIHAVRFAARAPAGPKVLRGVVRLEGKPESLAASVWRQVMRVIVREASV
jgi:putative peptide zinc metalloprotease protein